ncbi:hypothetical protein E2C01_017855 [Portunus trituberculatus]|uniref:Uncharacterized protein n=1 Tax=Portunus trituberculatus TaxID=210409 RepID=A0A5B7DT24_PORTR|nr:hypothetical protein [Portunus trituberculatus]
MQGSRAVTQGAGDPRWPLTSAGVARGRPQGSISFYTKKKQKPTEGKLRQICDLFQDIGWRGWGEVSGGLGVPCEAALCPSRPQRQHHTQGEVSSSHSHAAPASHGTTPGSQVTGHSHTLAWPSLGDSLCKIIN